MGSWHEKLGVFDLETTGVDVETARIVTAHVGVIDECGDVVERQDWMLDPGVPIPSGATAVHGITTERARADGIPAVVGVAQIVATLLSQLQRGIPVVAYNAAYDFTVLNREAVRHGIVPLATPAPVVDPLIIDRAVDRYRKGKRTLQVTAGHYGVPLLDAHDSGADAIAAGRVAQAIARVYAQALAIDAVELHRRQVAWCQEQAENFQVYMRRVRDPKFTCSGAWPER